MMRLHDGKYILEGHTPVRCEDIMTWGRFMELQNRVVEKTKVGDVEVSTVFIGLDHGWGEGPPILFETMIFGGKHDQFQERYPTWDEAVAGHEAAVRMVKEG